MSDAMFQCQPIGEVGRDADGLHLHVAEPFREGLVGLEGFSHLVVLWWCDVLDEPEYRAVRVAGRPYRDAPARIGVFATRGPMRPNPIALSAVPVKAVDPAAGIVRVSWIDAEPGRPSST